MFRVRCIHSVALATCCYASASTQATVVSNANFSFGGPYQDITGFVVVDHQVVPVFVDAYGGVLQQNVEATDYTDLVYYLKPNALHQYVLSIPRVSTDEESDWYVVQAGDAFGVNGIATHQFRGLFVSNSSLDGFIVPDGDFYLGFATSRGMETRDVFGWVHLRQDEGMLSMIDNAVSYQTAGIIVGTQIELPEPSGIGLLASAAIIAARRFTRTLQRR